ncbi:MAG: trypsin-like serine protease, partial [Pseudobdellovibrionaceae bacterium]
RNETFPQPVNDILVELHQEATNDIALVILASDAPKEYSFVTEMSTRWNGNENVQIVSSDNTLYFLGFGFVSSSNAGDRSLKIMSQQLGEQRVSSIFHRSNEFVWNQKQGGKICHGDSGGPIYSRRADRRIVLVGINQLVYTKDDNSPACSEFGVGTAVAPYRSWIRSQLKSLNLKFDE